MKLKGETRKGETNNMSDMPHWNEFVRSVLSDRQQDGPDKGATSANNLTFKKDSEKSRKEGVKNEQ